LVSDFESLDANVQSLEVQERTIRPLCTDDLSTQLHRTLTDVTARKDRAKLSVVERRGQMEKASSAAMQFHEKLSALMTWIGGVEQTLSGLLPASRIMEVLLVQIDEHKVLAASSVWLTVLIFLWTFYPHNFL